MKWEKTFMDTDILLEKNTKRTKKGDFWGGLECMSSGEGLMADWEWAFGSALSMLMPFLKPIAAEDTVGAR